MITILTKDEPEWVGRGGRGPVLGGLGTAEDREFIRFFRFMPGHSVCSLNPILVGSVINLLREEERDSGKAMAAGITCSRVRRQWVLRGDGGASELR